MDIIAMGIIAMFIAWRMSTHIEDIETAPTGQLILVCFLFWGGLTATILGSIYWGFKELLLFLSAPVRHWVLKK